VKGIERLEETKMTVIIGGIRYYDVTKITFARVYDLQLLAILEIGGEMIEVEVQFIEDVIIHKGEKENNFQR
jgi:hypothetical protein